MPFNEDRLATPALHRKDMPYVTFKSEIVEDPIETKKQGRMVSKDQHYARVTPPGSKDTFFGKIPHWFETQDLECKAGRILPEWLAKWRREYELFKQGQEIPLDGTPIRGWKMLSGAQQENLIRLNILTVESLSTINAEAMAQIGMGALEMKRRAEAWLAQNESNEHGAVQLSALQRELDVLKETNAHLLEKIEQLAKQAESGKKKSS